MMIRVLMTVGLAAACGMVLAQGAVYKSVGPDGTVTYSDKPDPKAKKMELPPMTTVPAPKAPPPDTSSGERQAPEARKAAGERADAEGRLAAEEDKLEAARKELAEQEGMRLGPEARNYQKYLDRVQPYRDAVTRQEQVVEELRKQMAQ